MSESRFVDLMSEAILATDGTEDEALTLFELRLLELSDPRLVWDLFEPVRGILLRRLYRMAQYQIEQADSGAQLTESLVQSRKPISMAPEPDEAADSPNPSQSTHGRDRHSAVSAIDDHRRKITPSHTQPRSPRGARSAQDVLMSIGGKKSHLDWLTNHRGVPIGDLTYYGLANSHDEAPIFKRFASRLMGAGIPKSGRNSDVVRKFITPEEADRIWLDLLKEVA